MFPNFQFPLSPYHFLPNIPLANNLLNQQLNSLLFANMLTFQQMHQNSQSQRTIRIKVEENIDRQAQSLPGSASCIPKLEKNREHHPIMKKFSIDQITQELSKLLKDLSNLDLEEESLTKHIETNFKVKDIRLNLKIVGEINCTPPFINLLIERYSNQKKTKEEQIKFVLRKCFKFLKQKTQLNDMTMSQFEIEKAFYKQYFPNLTHEVDDIEQIIPFRSKSTLKTMNVQYLKKIFKSPQFYQGYLEYLDHFEQIWNEENDEKVQNMVKQVVKLIQNNSLEKISTYRRIPWVVGMKVSCQKLAESLKIYADPNQLLPDHEIADN